MVSPRCIVFIQRKARRSVRYCLQAFRDKNKEHSAFWLTTLGHSIADEAACNHGPLLHYLTYYLQRAYQLPMGEGVGFDFHDAHKTEKGRAIAAKLLTGFTPKITATLPNEFYIRSWVPGYRETPT